MNFKMPTSLLVKPGLGSSLLSSPASQGSLVWICGVDTPVAASLCSAVQGEQEQISTVERVTLS